MRASAVVAAGGIALLASLALATPAFAHNSVVSTSPEAGSTVNELPTAISVTTNDTLLDLAGDGSGFAIIVQDSAGRFYGDGCFDLEGPTLSTDAALGAPGEYTVTWQVVSTDAHPVSDSFTFDWTGAATAAGSDEPGDCNGTVEAPTVGPAQAENGRAFDATLLWIVGAVVAVGVAVGVTLLLVRPRKRS